MKERKPHKWAYVIKSWAYGYPVQYRFIGSDFWIDEELGGGCPLFDEKNREWRVKPENIVVKTHIGYETDSFAGWGDIFQSALIKPNIQFEFNPDTKKLVKAEVIEK
ncbi:hypothetical protein [Oxalobacter paraformigenes]|nr:hypothetical protein [Oxalobacter paraformigenes]